MRTAIVAALVVLASPAIAADLPVAPTQVPGGYVPYKNYNWSSVYIGGNAGYGFATGSADVFGFSLGSEDLNGFVGGGQIGANYQVGAFVFGIEGDFSGSNQSKSFTGFINEKDEIQWFGTVRGRFGAAYDRWFFYITGGGGEGKFTVNASSPFATVSAEETHPLWTVGAGVEVGITDYLSARIEYLYFDTGTMSNFANVPGVNVDVQDNIIRAGLNLRLPY